MCLCEYSVSTRLASHPCLPSFISGVWMILPDFLVQLESSGGGSGMGPGLPFKSPGVLRTLQATEPWRGDSDSAFFHC